MAPPCGVFDVLYELWLPLVVWLQVENGRLDMDSVSVEPDKCFFHADDSGRLLHIGAEEVR